MHLNSSPLHMDIIPLIYIKDGALLQEKQGPKITIKELTARVEEDKMLYILDLDGIEHNNPNLGLYEDLSDRYTLWVDAGPRILDDVMDMIMAGATNITIRKNLWPNVNLVDLQEITEDEIYFTVDTDQIEKHVEFSVFSDVIGAVVLKDEKEIEEDQHYSTFLKEYAAKSKLYIYNVDPTNVPYWNERHVTGVLVDLSKLEGFKVHGS